MTNIGTIIANGTMLAFSLHAHGKGIEVTDEVVEGLRAEAEVAVRSILEMGEDLADMGEEMVRNAINIECNAAAGRVISAHT